MNRELLAKAKSLGFSDRQIAHLTGKSEDDVRALRKELDLLPSYRLVDTCAAEFEALHPIIIPPTIAATTRPGRATNGKS